MYLHLSIISVSKSHTADIMVSTKCHRYKVRFLTLYSWLQSMFNHVSIFDVSSSLLVKNNLQKYI